MLVCHVSQLQTQMHFRLKRKVTYYYAGMLFKSTTDWSFSFNTGSTDVEIYS